ncbi:vegetative cell wall protein gp1-like [Columba livia]|uniref:Vegetative cell wall protein gp1-like n=1 Tax=Columba livia TaxID=8932 RepID=A0A2I0LXB8_COLLI|nr:vegetative cell wall protein gp1-like [Columba livia]
MHNSSYAPQYTVYPVPCALQYIVPLHPNTPHTQLPLHPTPSAELLSPHIPASPCIPVSVHPHTSRTLVPVHPCPCAPPCIAHPAPCAPRYTTPP